MKKEETGDWVIMDDPDFIVVNKPPGVPVQKDKSGDLPLVSLIADQCQIPLHLVHRIDRPASGLVIFAKNKTALATLNQQFRERVVKKCYWAVVPRKEIPNKGQLIHYLRKDGKKHKAIVAKQKLAHYLESILNYEVIALIENYQLLKIQLETGRFHQIRAQLSAIDCPIKGDVKYGARRKNQDRSIHLHARELKFYHPITGEGIEVSAFPPDDSVWGAFNQ